eukprot:1157757-Pelagomonas_calceolata.AAC.22
MEQAHYPKTTSSCIHSLLSDRAEHVSLTILHCTSVPYWLKSSWLRLSLCLAPPVLACALQTDKRHEEVAAFAVIGLRLYAVWNLCCAWNSPLRSGGVSAALEDYLQPCPGGQAHYLCHMHSPFACPCLLTSLICRPVQKLMCSHVTWCNMHFPFACPCLLTCNLQACPQGVRVSTLFHHAHAFMCAPA